MRNIIHPCFATGSPVWNWPDRDGGRCVSIEKERHKMDAPVIRRYNRVIDDPSFQEAPFLSPFSN